MVAVIYVGSCLHAALAVSLSQSIDGVPENASYIYRNHSLKSTRRARFQMNTVNDRLWVVDIAPGQTPKALGDRHANGLSPIRRRTVLDLVRAHWLRQRCVASVLLILLELEF